MASNDGISANSAPNDGASPPPLPPSLPPPRQQKYCYIATAEEVSDDPNTAEYYYMNGGSRLKVLVAMCHGLWDYEGNPVLSLDGNPWRTFPVLQICPNKDGYAKEVICCWDCENCDSDTRRSPFSTILHIEMLRRC